MKIVDTESLKSRLSSLYSDKSKHSSYQSVPTFVADAIGYQVEINEDWRGDRVRLEYILSRFSDTALSSWVDFGANTGFFSLSLAHADPTRNVLAIEANPNHANFIKDIATAFGMANVQVLGKPIAIDDLATLPPCDVMLHLNVLHHAGADFDVGRVVDAESFMKYAREYLRRLSGRTKCLVFQIGTNLWGDKSRPIIDYREDSAKLEMLAQLLTQSGWRVEDVAYASRMNGESIRYEPFDEWAAYANRTAGLARFNLGCHIGEFYRRPLFICSSVR